ncbi:MAG TPA: hypothetical protein DCW44_00225 [Eubacterium sp.]|nr:hypothetical protein [Eubacterium sp.]
MRKSLKKPLSMILSAAMVFTSYNYNPIDVNAAEINGKVEVKSYADLKNVQKELDSFVTKNESNLKNCTFTIDIKNDIVGNDLDWIGIKVGHKNAKTQYSEIKTMDMKVVVNGNGHTISKLSNKNQEKFERDIYYYSLSGTDQSTGVGLFGDVYASLEASNITFANLDLKTRTSNSSDTNIHDQVQTDWNAASLAGSVYGNFKASDITIKDSALEGIGASGALCGAYYTGNDTSKTIELKNIKVENTKVSASTQTGGIIGALSIRDEGKRGKIENCTVDKYSKIDGSAILQNKLSNAKKIFVTEYKHGEMSGSGEGFAGMKVGGIVGAASKVDIINCLNNGAVDALKPNSAFTGGIVGFGTDVTIKGCANTGNVNGNICVGGIAGELFGDSIILDSKNSGKIKATEQVAGGIIGEISREVEVKDVVNTGSVDAKSYVGGITGVNSGTLTNADNSGNITGADVVGGNVGYNRKNGKCDGLSNEGDVVGKDNVGGNIGLNEGEAKNLGNNNGKVTGNDNVGGNIGQNDKTGVADTLLNTGDVTGHDNVGGNVGDNKGKVTNVVNSGKVDGNEGVGGNVGNNEREASVSTAVNTGEAKGNKDVDKNIGKNDGYSHDLDNYPSTDDGAVIIGPKDPNYPDLPEYDNTLLGMKFRVSPKGKGALIFKSMQNGEITLLISPVYGYKFDNWKADGTTPAMSKSISESFKIKKGAVVEAHLSEAKKGDTLVPALDESAKTPSPDLNKVTFYEGLTLAVTPAKAGRIDLVSKDNNNLSITAVPQLNAKFVEWQISGKVSLAKGSSKDSQTATFVYKKGDKATITAVFKFGTAPAVGKKVKDRKYFYRVTKAGSFDGSIVGELQVIGLRRKSLTQIKIAAKGTIDGINYRVTSIGANAFKGNKKVTSVYVSRYVTKIGNKAFANMKKLKKVTLGSGLKKIGSNVFAKDKKLKNVVIKSKKLKKIGKKAFATGKKITFKLPKSKKNKYKKLLIKAKTRSFRVK